MTSPLTPRETEVLRLLAQGRNVKLIGRALDITQYTVRDHLTHIYRKIEVNGRCTACVWAAKNGLA